MTHGDNKSNEIMKIEFGHFVWYFGNNDITKFVTTRCGRASKDKVLFINKQAFKIHEAAN